MAPVSSKLGRETTLFRVDDVLVPRCCTQYFRNSEHLLSYLLRHTGLEPVIYVQPAAPIAEYDLLMLRYKYIVRIIIQQRGLLAQWLAHRFPVSEVAGSSPVWVVVLLLFDSRKLHLFMSLGCVVCGVNV